jgi:hypothetical protein
MSDLTVTYAELNAATKRTSGALKYLGFRSSELMNLLQKLNFHENSKGDGIASLAVLKAAARTWRRNHPKEFANRDKLSDGLCSKLLTELAIPPQQQESPEPNCMAYEIINDQEGVDALKPAKGKFTQLDGSVFDAIRDRASKEGVRIGILIIDVQTSDKLGALAEANRVSDGLHVKYDSQSVLQNQADVVALATELKLPIFNVTASLTGNMRTVDALTSKFPANNENVHDFNKSNNNVMGDMDLNNSPKFLKTLEDQLGKEGNRYLVVMGFNANQCVQGSVFGNEGIKDYETIYGKQKGYPKVKGLLEYGFTIITARTILASATAPLEAAWGPMVTA